MSDNLPEYQQLRDLMLRSTQQVRKLRAAKNVKPEPKVDLPRVDSPEMFNTCNEAIVRPPIIPTESNMKDRLANLETKLRERTQ